MATQQARDATFIPGEVHKGRRSPWLDVLVRLVREKPLGLIGGIIVLVIVTAAILAPVIAISSPTGLGPGNERLLGPSLSHPFGTDNLARDVYSRVVYGAQVSIVIGFLSVFTATCISLLIGVTSGYFGGKIDLIFQRLVDAFVAFPALVFLIAVGAIFTDSKLPLVPASGVLGSNNIILFLTLGFVIGVGQSRVIRGAALSIRESAYVEASRAVGASHVRMLLVHVLPNVMAPTITLATLGLGSAILIEASLSFLGLGVTPDIPSWGGMLNREARSFMTDAPWLALAPGIALSATVFGFNMLGDALRDLLDPRLRT